MSDEADGYTIHTVLPAKVYRRLTEWAAAQGSTVEALAAEMVASTVEVADRTSQIARLRADLAEAREAARLASQQLADAQRELENARAQAHDAARQLNRMTQGEHGA